MFTLISDPNLCCNIACQTDSQITKQTDSQTVKQTDKTKKMKSYHNVSTFFPVRSTPIATSLRFVSCAPKPVCIAGKQIWTKLEKTRAALHNGYKSYTYRYYHDC